MKLSYHTSHLLRKRRKGLNEIIYKLFDYWNTTTIARQVINKDIIEFIPSINGDIVEIGGNTSLQKLHSNGKYILLELEDSPDNDITANAECLPFQSNSVHGFICISVLEHTLNPNAVINEIWRCLRPGGKAFISVPWLFETHMAPKDYCRFSSFLLSKWFEKFKTIKLEPVNSYVGLLAHYFQKQILTRYLFGTWLFLLDLLLKPSFTWTTQINAHIQKPLEQYNENDFDMERWPNNIRCPLCAPIGKGRLIRDNSLLKCQDCGKAYSIIEKRVLFS